MGIHKWDFARIAILPLPFVFIAAYFLDAALPVPSFLLRERRYLAFGKDSGIEALIASRGRGEAFASLPDRLEPLPPSPSEERLRELALALPDSPDLEPVIADLAGGIGYFRRARLVSGEAPLASELAQLRAASEAHGLPLAIEVADSNHQLPVSALSRRLAPMDRRMFFELLLPPRARGFRSLELAASASGALLYRASGASLPADLVLRLSAERSDAPSISIRWEDGAGRIGVGELLLGSALEDRPRVLVIGDPGRGPGFVESLYPARRISLAEADAVDLLAYELVVIDGLPLSRIRGRFLAGLQELAGRKAGSLLFAADSPDFGKKGDNPPIEALLPVSLLPRSLKDLPDLGVLILIDVSGSMFGDKLSLAKVTGLEVLRNLKEGDLVGMMLFSDEREWIYEFPRNESITAAPALAPVSARGGTDLHPALAEGLDRLGRLGIKEKHAIVITDGVTKPADFAALADSARSRGITISAMGIGEDVDRALLERLAAKGGGRYYRVSSADEIPALIFEDRLSVARPAFAQGRIPIHALDGSFVARIGGMAQYAALPAASVVFANALGDPLLASAESGNRAVILFASDLHGTYTADFLASPLGAGTFKDRLDALFTERPLEVSISETARGTTILLRSEELTAPRALLSRDGRSTREAAFRKVGTASWTAEAALPDTGAWNASIVDKGAVVASFPLAANLSLS
ncbi:MAG: VWA domain-containing protein, partial [Spirochaetaceae bacterium]|nr:VWA domain-containing protein [Spirochaetaceae bacterium]